LTGVATIRQNGQTAEIRSSRQAGHRWLTVPIIGRGSAGIRANWPVRSVP
jgi:hypothetical protein